jgi:16S rRNA (cytosine967-C5)-methyltransferase
VENFGNVSPARRAAFTVLEQVENTFAHVDDMLHGPALAGLSQQDRNLATALALGVLRWQIALDAQMRPMLQRPEMQLASPVASALRMGAFQLLHMDRIPAHAALSESVELVRAAGHPHAAGMVNAVLRRLQREPPQRPKVFETTQAFAERLGHPAWLVERWVRSYGRAAALEICAYDQQEPATGGLFKRPGGLEELRPAASEVIPGAASEVLEESEAVSGFLPRMDDGSRLVAELAAASVAAPERIWDCCAAPGGKTMVLALRHAEAALLATDVQPKRLAAMAQRLKLAAPQARVKVADATKLPQEDGAFDLILCDVPCSGTGTLSRNPEIRLRLSAADIARQAERQVQILGSALERLRPGGRLLYSTCSLEPEENEAVVDRGLKAGSSGAVEVGLGAAMARLEAVGELTDSASVGRLLRGGRLRTLPGASFQGDGFFAALFERR